MCKGVTRDDRTLPLKKALADYFITITPFNISNAEYYIKKLKFKLVVHYGVKLQIQTFLHC